MTALLHPTYLPNISHFAAILQAENVVFEAWDSFQKQTYRNRAYIYSANGKLQLNIPVRHTQKERKYYKDVEIAYDENWQLNHKRSIESAYRTSPFFEFYEDEILPIYAKKETYLFDFNIRTIEILLKALQVIPNFELSDKYESEVEEEDFRMFVNPKVKSEYKFESYRQVFDQKHGFISNLSVIDLICNEGPNSLDYLKRQQLIMI